LREWSGVREDLSRIKGIGPWTLDIYEMFCLRRADAFASGDLALKEALRLCEQTESRLTTKALEARSLAWSPVRAVAAKALWADYTQRRAGSR
jgi:DNA-3-methyladenine glycosylase II